MLAASHGQLMQKQSENSFQVCENVAYCELNIEDCLKIYAPPAYIEDNFHGTIVSL